MSEWDCMPLGAGVIGLAKISNGRLRAHMVCVDEETEHHWRQSRGHTGETTHFG
jgi:hypothetical protein